MLLLVTVDGAALQEIIFVEIIFIEIFVFYCKNRSKGFIKKNMCAKKTIYEYVHSKNKHGVFMTHVCVCNNGVCNNVCNNGNTVNGQLKILCIRHLYA